VKIHDLTRYRCIKSDALIHFLLDLGWREFDKKDEIVAIWGIEKESKIHKILLPLNPSSPDYPNRMIEAIKIVGLVETREESDILAIMEKSNED
jgi:hypothetical protein